MLLLGIAFALSFAPLNIQATNGVHDDEQGLASGLLNTSGQVGGAIVLAVVSAVLTAGAPLSIESLRSAIVVSLVLALVGVAISATGLRVRKPVAAPQEEAKVYETV